MDVGKGPRPGSLSVGWGKTRGGRSDGDCEGGGCNMLLLSQYLEAFQGQ